MLYMFTAGFYGKESSSQEKLPIKTDQDTLREGYRYWQLLSEFSKIKQLLGILVPFQLHSETWI